MSLRDINFDIKEKMIDKEYEEYILHIYKKAIEELSTIGIVPSENIRKVSVNRRAKQRLGCCKMFKVNGSNEYEIEISEMLKGKLEKDIMNVMIHELLHSMPDCMNHGKIWKLYAKKVEAELGYNISSTTNYMELNIEAKEKNYKYEITCKKCGAKMYRTRKCNLTEKTRNYRCGKCKGILVVHQL